MGIKGSMNARLAKLSPPRMGALLSRQRICTAIGKALEKSICWLPGPPGSGKTSAVLDYLSCHKPYLFWYRCDSGDEEPSYFINYLQVGMPPDVKRKLPLYNPNDVRLTSKFFRAFFMSLPKDSVLVFDELQLIKQPSFWSMFAKALDELPPRLSCICISRTLPPNEFCELEVKGQLSVIDPCILTFTSEEAQQLLSESGVSAECAQMMHQLTQGWVAGLAVTREQINKEGERLDIHSCVRNYERFLFDYLNHEVIEPMPISCREALIKTSLLPELTVDTVTYLAECSETDFSLEALYRQQLFITKQSGKPSIYLCHDLLRSLLRSQLTVRFSEREVNALKYRAAQLLCERNNFDQGIPLAIESGDWRYAADILRKQASYLLKLGKRKSFVAWLSAFPKHDFQPDAWLSYWLGIAQIYHDSAAAEQWFVRAYSLFDDTHDQRGMLLTACAALHGRDVVLRNNEGVEVWVQFILAKAEQDFHFEVPNDEVRFLTGIICAAWFHKKYGEPTAIVEKTSKLLLKHIVADDDLDIDQRVLASRMLLSYAAYDNHPELFEHAITAVIDYLDDRRLCLLAKAHWLSQYAWAKGRRFPQIDINFQYADPRSAVSEVIRIGESTRLQSILAQGYQDLYLVTKTRCDIGELGELVHKWEKIIDQKSSLQRQHLSLARAAIHALKGEHKSALRITTSLLDCSRDPPAEQFSLVLTHFQSLFGEHRCIEAIEFLRIRYADYSGLMAQQIKLSQDFASTWVLRQTCASGYRRSLESTLTAAKSIDAYNVLPNLPSVISNILADGLRYGFEVDFCKEVIRRRQLQPPTLEIPHWPWPVKVYVLGGVKVVIDGKPLQVRTKAQKKPLELLKILIATLEGNAQYDYVCRLLWPEKKSFEAKKALEINIHRLRKLLQNDAAIFVMERGVGINHNLVWIDALAFNQRANEVLLNLQKSASIDTQNQIEELINLYRGALYGGELILAPAIPLRKRLEEKYLQLLINLGHCYERSSKWELAVQLYERGLVENSLTEELYRGLMRCHVARGERAAAVNAYQRCREKLSIVLGITPSAATTSLLKEIKKPQEIL